MASSDTAASDPASPPPPRLLSSERRMSVNVVASTSATLVNALSGFLTLPFLVAQLGPGTYGLWTLVFAVASYFVVLETGATGAVGRVVAGLRSRDDVQAINSLLTTTFAVMGGVGVVLVAGFLGVAWAFPSVFIVPTEQVDDVRAALMVMGLSAAISLPSVVFNGTLFGYERFDLGSLIEIPTLVARTSITFAVVTESSSVETLAWIVLATTAASQVARGVACWWIEPRLRLDPRLFSRPAIRELYAFGGWYGLLTLARGMVPQIATFVIGAGIGPVGVTAYAIPRLLVVYANWIMASASQVVIPRAAVFHFEGDQTSQRLLFLAAGRYSFALALYLAGGMALLGDVLLAVWQPKATGAEYELLLVLLAGEVLPMSQWATAGIVLGIGQHRRLALLGMAEGVSTLALALVLLPAFGLIGACAGVSLSSFLFRGVLTWAYGCRLLGITKAEAARRTFLPVAIGAGCTFLTFLALKFAFDPRGWTGLLVGGTLYSVIYALLLAPVLPALRSNAGYCLSIVGIRRPKGT